MEKSVDDTDAALQAVVSLLREIMSFLCENFYVTHYCLVRAK